MDPQKWNYCFLWNTILDLKVCLILSVKNPGRATYRDFWYEGLGNSYL